ncbi:MAG: hypothetical protein MZV64_18905 [Ignavibacteriales bacterium]|nr:hypothetical protein [Ignavibacteriales bacterium]
MKDASRAASEARTSSCTHKSCAVPGIGSARILPHTGLRPDCPLFYGYPRSQTPAAWVAAVAARVSPTPHSGRSPPKNAVWTDPAVITRLRF